MTRMTPIMATRMGASEMTTEFPAIYKEERELATRMTPVIPRMATNLVSGPICWDSRKKYIFQ